MKNRFTTILIIASALWMFGLSAQAQTQTGPRIGRSVYGGGKGSSAIVTGDVLVEVQSGTVGTLDGGTLTAGTGDVYGGGALANVDGGTTVDLKGGTVLGDLYGGGALAHVNVTSQGGHTQGANAKVTVSGGSVRTVYGGGMGQSTPSAVAALVYGNTSVTIVGGTINGKQISTGINGGVFGGCNERGTVLGGATVTINSPVGQSNNHLNVYGGGLGANTNVQGSVAVEIKEDDDITPAIFGDVYGGSAKGLVNYAYNNNNTPTTPNDGENIATTVTLTDGTVTGDIYGGGHGLDGASANVGREVTVTIEGGSVETYGTDNVNGGNVFGCNNAAGSPLDTVNVYVRGGALRNVFGGGNLASKTGKGVAVTYNATPSNSEIDTIFGGGNKAGVVGNVKVIMVDGTVNKGIYGGCNASGNIGGKITVNVEGGTIGTQANLELTTPVVANVFGGGYGENTTASGNVEVNIGTGTTGPDIYGDVYGGSALGSVNSLETNTTKVNILNGTLHSVIDATSGFKVYHGGNVYGGGLGQNGIGNEAKGQVNGEIIVNVGAAAGATTGEEALEEHSGNATIGGNVYGCNNTSGSPQQDVTVNIFGTAHTTGANGNAVDGVGFAIANVFGGGNEANYAPTVSGKKASVNVFGCKNTVERVFGGGNAAATPSVGTDIQGGRFSEVYGGGNGERGTDFAADINGNVSLVIHGGDVGMFFVGSNQNGTITGSSSVSIDDEGPCEETQIEEFFCGGNYANFVGNIDATIECSNSLNVRNLYGGCNQADVVDNPATTEVEGNIHLKVYGGHFENVYGGSKGTETEGANIEGNVQLDIFGGVIDTIFGGSNIKGNVAGSIIVNIMNNGECDFEVHNVYGGGRNAAYRPTVEGDYPEVNIIHGTISKKVVGSVKTGGIVFGGGYGESAVVASNPKVRVGYDATMAGYIPTGYSIAETSRLAVVDSLVFGGGDQAPVAGSTNVTIQKFNSSANRLFGGGNNANVGNATVNVDNGIVTGGVYGGCNTSGTVGGTIDGQPYDGTILVNLNGGKVGTDNSHRADVYGGGFGGGNNGTFTNGNITVTLQQAAEVFGDLYGGSAFGSVNAASSTTTVNVSNDKLHGQVFGGGKGQLEGANQVAYTATTNGNVVVNISAANTNGNLTGIYGGANVKGNIVGNIDVNVTANVGASGTNNRRDIFGGGLGANTTTNGDVTVKIGEGTTPVVYGDIYGGSALGQVSASDKLTKVDFLNGTLNGTLYGGGMGQIGNNPVAAEVTGNVQVAVGNGSISGGVYGGCNLKGSVKGDITVDVNGASIGAEGAPASVFGGGYGNNTTTEGNVIVNLNGTSATVWGDIYGGSAEGNVNKVNNNNTTTVNILNGTVKRDIYGGGLGTNDYAAAVNGAVVVNIGSDENTGNAILNGNVYGCNNTNGSPQDNVTVNIYKTHREASQETSGTGFAIANVFGGGNQAAYSPTGTQTASVIIHGCSNTIEDVFGGGDAAAVKKAAVEVNGGRFNRVFAGGNGEVTAANIGSGGTSLLVKAGKIHQLFGGSNERGVIEGPITVTLNHDNTTCVEEIDEFFGGSNLAAIGTDANPATLVTTIECGVGTITDVYGGSNAADIIGNVTLNIEGGTITNAYGGSKGRLDGDEGGVKAANILDKTNGNGTYGNVTLNLFGGTITNAFGGSNRNGDIDSRIIVNMLDKEAANCGLTVHNIYGASNLAAYSPNNDELVSPVVNLFHGSVTKSGANTTDGNVYGGAKGSTATVTANPKVNVGYIASMTLPADITSISKAQVSVAGNVYGGGDEAAVSGGTTIMVQRKEISNDYTTAVSGNIFGGGNLANVSAGTIVNINGGTVSQDVYGGGALANTGGSNVTLAGGTVTQDIYGGGLGRAAATGVEPIAAQVTGAVQVTVTSGSVRDVYGCNNVNGSPTNTVTVDIEGPVGNNVYGGGNLATSGITPVVNIMTGANVTGSVFGGGNNASVAGGDVNMQAGTILGGLYGGCNTNGSSGNITVDVTGGTIGASGTPANVHGGGYGNGTSTTGDVEVTINGSSAAIWGDVYGGSAKGHVNDAAADHTNVTLTSGTIHGDLYGGGLGDADNAATVNGAVQVTVNGGTVTGSVYGCNNANGAPQSTVKVDIYGTDTPTSGYALANVFGGGNQAAYSGSPEVTVHNCNNSIGYVYGGGNKASVAATNVTIYGGNTIGYVFGGGNGQGVATDYTMVSGNAVANIYGGTIDHVFGGNNSSGAISGTVTVNVDKQTESGHNSCDMYIGEVYGGGNLAAGNAGTITIGCTGSLVSGANGHIAHPENIGTTLEGVGTVYGGANQAGIGNDIQLDINNGIVNKVFGGNNTSGNIDGTIQVNIEKTGTCDWYVGEVYGGGNHAEYNGTPDVNIIAGTVYRNVYGGGNDITDGTKGVVDSDVEMTGGTVLGGVYGGCNEKGTVTGNSLVKIYGGTIGSEAQLEATPRVVAQVFGGGLGANTKVNGNVTVNVNKGDNVTNAPTIWGDVYGGSALGSVNTSNANTTTVNILDGTLGTKTTTGTTPNGQTYYNYFGGNVFGGGLGDATDATKGQVKGKVFVNIGTTPSGRSRDLDPVNDTCIGNATIKGNVYGCNNTNGSPLDDVTVNIYRTHRDATDEINYLPESGDPEPTFAIANVFGGGNRANYTASDKTASVNIFSCYNSIQRVFGGGNAAAAPNVHTMIQGGRFAEVFGGGNGEVSAANITGNVNLEIHGGTVGEFYVGSNQNGSISGTSNVTVDQSSGCEEVNITEFYCGGKYADFVGDINATITCSQDMHVTNLYGGCKEAHVKAGNGGSGNIHLTVVGGTFENVYGGSRGTQTKGADIEGNITLDIFGGTITKAIYGGSNVKGAIGGTITVNVEDKYPNDNCSLEVSTADVYGGGNQADYPGIPDPTGPLYNLPSHAITHTSPYNYPEVNIKNATVKNVFGGGLKAEVIGNPQIHIKKGSKVLGNVYGGGNMGEVTGNPKVIINGKQTN